MMNKKEQILATRAFSATSFDPEQRLDRFAEDFEREEAQIIELCEKYGVDAGRLLEKHFILTMDYLNAESRCASAAIVGPAKFPVAEMEKRVASAMGKLSKLCYFMEHLEKTLIKITRPKETQADKKQKWIKKVEDLKALQEQMKMANKLLRKNDIAGLVELVGEEEAEELQEPNCFGQVGYPDFKLRNNLANIKRLEAQIEQIDRLKEKEISDFEIAGGVVKYDPEEIRFNIFFDEKPDEETRTKLKSRGFKWSPRRGAWTRGAKTINIKTIKNMF